MPLSQFIRLRSKVATGIVLNARQLDVTVSELDSV